MTWKNSPFVLIILLACGTPPPVVVTPPHPSAMSAEAGPPIVRKPTYPYPPTRTTDTTENIFGITLKDSYRWLEDGKSTEVKDWLKVQDDFAHTRLSTLPERDAIAGRLKELFYIESQSPPFREGARYFFSRREAQQEKTVVFWREGKKGAPKTLLDPNKWSEDGSVSLGTFSVSHDGKTVGYTQKGNNSDEATLYVMDIATGKKSEIDTIEGAKYAHPSWSPKGDGFVYTWIPPVDDKTITVKNRPGFAEVRFHKLGEDPKKDRIVHECTKDPKTFIGGELSRDGHFMIVYVHHGWTATDVYFKDLRKGEPKDFTLLVSGKPHKYDVEAFGDKLYVRTDDGAPNGHILVVDPTQPARDQWKEIVAERKDATLDGWTIVGKKIALAWLKDVVSLLEIVELDGKHIRNIDLPAIGAASVPSGQQDQDEAYYTFTSFTHPTEIYETSISTGKTALHYRLKSPVEPEKFMVEQRFAQSKDGTRVPFFVVRAKDRALDGTAPTILYGYGGFLGTQYPTFVSSAYPWMERGGIYVVANLRGGAEYGEAWHRAGMRDKKQNVFDDFYAVAKKLVEDKVTTSQRLAIRGASNGGLLVGAAMIEHPEMYRVVLCGVPLLDMMRYHLFGSGQTWIEEYGSAEKPDEAKYIYDYSPYQHVAPNTKYPSLLMLTADADDRVDPMHARKFAALMQAQSAGGIVLIRVEHHSGHGGADLVRATVEKMADELAFALNEIRSPLQP